MNEQINEHKQVGYVFKVLSGAINGIEFTLGPHSYFMCVGDAVADEGNLSQNFQYAERTLYLPAIAPCHNFVVDLTENNTDDEFEVIVTYPDRQETLRFAYNVVCRVASVYFSLRSAEQQWSAEVISNTPSPSMISPVAEQASVTKRPHASPWGAILVGALCFFLLAGGITGWLSYEAQPDQSSNKLHQLVGDNGGYSVQLGRDNTYYLFAKDEKQADWARQAVVRSRSKEVWKVLTPHEEEARLSHVLDRNNIAFFTIRFTDPSAPTLVMSSTRNATDNKSLERISQMLLDVLPYAKKVNIDLRDDKYVMRIAQEGLNALGFGHQAIQSDSGVTLSGDISDGDGHMAEVNRFVEQFYRTWGKRYVHFLAEFRDDTSKDKSFRYGDDGFITTDKSHWSFSKKQS